MNQQAEKCLDGIEIEQYLAILQTMNDNQLIMAALSIILERLTDDDSNLSAALVYELQRRATGDFFKREASG